MTCITHKNFKKSFKKTRKNINRVNFKTAVIQKTTSIYDTFKVDYNIWIFIHVYNFGKFLDVCFKSIKEQTFKNVNLVIIDDCSTDNSPKLIKDWAKQFESHHVITNKSNKGPGYTKWQSIEYISKTANKNDIYIILDGDDAFSSNLSLEIIVNAYITKKCWMTHGSEDDSSLLKQNDYEQIRKKKFKIQHPRTCLCFLLDYIVKEDFMDRDKKWLLRCTEVAYIFKLIELCGEKNVYNIKDHIYFYRYQDDNVSNKISQDYKKDILDFIATSKTYTQIEEKIHIVMCCYIRHENLKEIIEKIDNQTVAKRIVFHIVNTNPKKSKWDYIKELITKKGLFKNIEIKICNTNENLFGYARFLYVKHLLKSTIVPYVIFIDDDMKLKRTWIENIYKTRAPLNYMCWYGRIFNKFRDINKFNYNNSISSLMKNFKEPKFDSLKEFEYGGTGGCIVDTNIFRFDILFRCPDEYRNIEDLWLSFIVKNIIGGKINVYRDPIILNQFENESKTALYKTIGDRKSDFLQMLIKCGFLKVNGFFEKCLNKMVEKDNDSLKSIEKFTF